MSDVDGWSCDQRVRSGASCRDPHGCHCREITDLRKQVEIALTALRRINSLAEKNVPKYAQQIASETLPRL
jgi:hypothetical protein